MGGGRGWWIIREDTIHSTGDQGDGSDRGDSIRFRPGVRYDGSPHIGRQRVGGWTIVVVAMMMMTSRKVSYGSAMEVMNLDLGLVPVLTYGETTEVLYY